MIARPHRLLAPSDEVFFCSSERKAPLRRFRSRRAGWLRSWIALFALLVAGWLVPPSARADDHTSDVVGGPPAAELPELPSGFNRFSGGWITFEFPASKRHRVQPLIVEADAFRESLRDLFGVPVLEDVTLRVARTHGEMASLAPKGWGVPNEASGVAYPTRSLALLTIEPVHPNSDHSLVEVFRHELAHLALADALNGHSVPRWLNEGFAIHLSGESPLSRLQTLSSASLASRLLPLHRLEDAFPRDTVERQVAYAQSADVVRHMLRTQDSERFMSTLRRISTGQPFADALKDAYGLQPYGKGSASLEDEWLREVAKRYSFWPVLFSGGVLWVGAFGLLVLAYRRRRRQQRVTLQRWAVEEAAEQEVAEAPRMHIVLASSSKGRGSPREVDIPKIEHDGSWHTLH